MNHTLTTTEIIETTQRWLEKAVIGLNLCPFAKSVYVKNQVGYTVSDAHDVDALFNDLVNELKRLKESTPEALDTILLIHPWVLEDFLDYNDFLDVADAALAELGLEGELQIASFHPQYQFADMSLDDISNYTNRAPFPILHLLRESSIDRAVAAFPDASRIYETNIATMNRLGHEGWKRLNIDSSPLNSAETNEKYDRT